MPVLNKKEVTRKVIEVIKLCLNEQYNSVSIEKVQNPDQLLILIASNSIWVTNLLMLIEDEFDIEIDDDDICLELFQSIENLINTIMKSLISYS